MTVEMEMMNEENGRLRRHIKTLEAELKKLEAAQAQAAVEPVGKVLEVAEDGSFQAGFFEELPVGTLLYTQEAIAAARVQAINECAEHMENQHTWISNVAAAQAIRALIGKEST